MNAVQHTQTNTVTMRVMWLAVALALFASSEAIYDQGP